MAEADPGVEDRIFQDAVKEAKRLESIKVIPPQKTVPQPEGAEGQPQEMPEPDTSGMGELFEQAGTSVSITTYEKALEDALFCESRAPRKTKEEAAPAVDYKQLKERQAKEELERMKQKFTKVEEKKEAPPAKPAPAKKARQATPAPEEADYGAAQEPSDAEYAHEKPGEEEAAPPKPVPKPTQEKTQEGAQGRKTFYERIEKRVETKRKQKQAVKKAPGKNEVAKEQKKAEKLETLRARLAEKIKKKRKKSIEQEKAEKLEKSLEDDLD